MVKYALIKSFNNFRFNSMEKLSKQQLKEITARWCKSILSANEPMVSFYDTELTLEEIEYIQKHVQKIADKIAPNFDVDQSVDQILEDYFE